MPGVLRTGTLPSEGTAVPTQPHKMATQSIGALSGYSHDLIFSHWDFQTLSQLADGAFEVRLLVGLIGGSVMNVCYLCHAEGCSDFQGSLRGKIEGSILRAFL